MTKLEAGNIHLWVCFYNEVEDETLLDRYFSLLSPDEVQQRNRFQFEDDKKRYLLTRASLRTLLSKYAPVPPMSWCFEKSSQGKPYISESHGEAAKIQFNITHTENLIVIALANSCRLGIDVENHKSRDASIEVAKRFFAPREFRDIQACEESTRQKRFFEYWTFKESYLKAQGMGIHHALDKAAFRFPDSRGVELICDGGDESERWGFWQFSLRDEYTIALCVEELFPGKNKIQISQIQPTGIETPLQMELCRVSDNGSQ